LQQAEVVAYANRHRLTLVAVDAEQLTLQGLGETSQVA
jgi:hypothetical protein